MSVEAVKKLGSFNYEVLVSGHKLIYDVAEKFGGTGDGPEPRGFLESALATCTAITLQNYAEQMGIPLVCTDVKVHITNEGTENKIEREITLVGELLTEEQRKNLSAVADESPIYKFLTQGAEIRTKLASPELFVGL